MCISSSLCPIHYLLSRERSLCYLFSLNSMLGFHEKFTLLEILLVTKVCHKSLVVTFNSDSIPVLFALLLLKPSLFILCLFFFTLLFSLMHKITSLHDLHLTAGSLKTLLFLWFLFQALGLKIYLEKLCGMPKTGKEIEKSSLAHITCTSVSLSANRGYWILVFLYITKPLYFRI